MKNKAENPAPQLRGKNVPEAVRLYFELVHLKQIFRQGWIQRGIPAGRCESVAEHSYAVALLAMFWRDRYLPELDLLKVLRLSLLHDFGEVDAGDITPVDKVSPEQKLRLEREAFRRILSEWGGGNQYLELWEEYSQSKSPEARFVRQVEKLEMALQASVYEHQGLADLEEFYASARKVVHDSELREILEELENLR